MSPELYEKIKGKQKGLLIDLKGNDHFSLGMTMLSLSLGNSLQDCYLPSGDFDQNKLQEYITLMKKGCSNQDLVSKIDCHLTSNSDLRQKYLDLHGIQACLKGQQQTCIVQEESNKNYFEINGQRTPNKTTVTYYQNGQQINYQPQQMQNEQGQDSVQYYYSQYNPNYQAYQPSYVNPNKTQIDQSTQDQTQYNNQVVQSTIIRKSYQNLQPVQTTDSEYTSEWTVDEQGRRVEIRRYKPGYKPNGFDSQPVTVNQPKILRRSYVQQAPVQVPLQESQTGQKVTYYNSYEEYLQAKQKEKEQLVEQQTYQNQDAYNYYLDQQQDQYLLLKLQFYQLFNEPIVKCFQLGVFQIKKRIKKIKENNE